MRTQMSLILLLTAQSLGAQAHPQPDRPRLDPVPRPAGIRRDSTQHPAVVRRERIVAQLHQLRKGKLQESLGLPEEKAKAIADRWSKFDADSVGRRQQMMQLRQQVNATLMGPGNEDEKNRKLQPIVDQITTLRQEQQRARDRFEADVSGTLSPAQQGRFLLLMDEFQKSLQDAIREQRKER